MKPFKAWLLFDAEGTYFSTLHATRREAVAEAKCWEYLRDAKWRVIRVSVRRVDRKADSNGM